MKTKLSNLTRLLLLSCSVISFQIWSQDIITSWDFHNSNTIPNVGSGSTLVWGSLNSSFPSSTYGKCWQVTNFANQSAQNATRGVGFLVNTTGYGSISLTFSQRATGPASRWARLDYSLDAGLNWVNNFWVNAGGLSPQDSWQSYTVDFSSVIGADNNPDFRGESFPFLAPLLLMSRIKLVLFPQTQLT